MPMLTIDRFSKGLDLRRLPSVTDADRLLQAKNVYVNKGGQIVRRPPLDSERAGPVDAETNNQGLYYSHGEWRAFTTVAGRVNQHDGGLYYSSLPGSGGSNFTRILSTHAAVSARTDAHEAGTPEIGRYVVAEFPHTPIYQHFFQRGDGYSPGLPGDARTFQRITDDAGDTAGTALGFGAAAIALAGRMFVSAKDRQPIVRYSALDDPKDFSIQAGLSDSTENKLRDAGFLPNHLGPVTAFGSFRGQLVVFSADGITIWQVGTRRGGDPERDFELVDELHGVGCLERHAQTVAKIGGNTIWRAPEGYRMLGTERETNRIVVREVGSPIDALILDRQDGAEDEAFLQRAVASPTFDQYLCFWSLHRCDVFTYSRDDQVAAWSEYEFGTGVGFPAVEGGTLYLRQADTDANGALSSWRGALKLDAKAHATRDTISAATAGMLTPLNTETERNDVFTGISASPPSAWRLITFDTSSAIVPHPGGWSLYVPQGGTLGEDGSYPRYDSGLPPVEAWWAVNLYGHVHDHGDREFELTSTFIATGANAARQFDFFLRAAGSGWGKGSHLVVYGQTADGTRREIGKVYGSAALPPWPSEGPWADYSGRMHEPIADLQERGSIGGYRGLRIERFTLLRGETRLIFKIVLGAGVTASDKTWLELSGVAAHSYTAVAPIGVEVQMAFLDAKRPGVPKLWEGCKVSQRGACELSFAWPGVDAQGNAKEFELAKKDRRHIRGEGMGRGMIPIHRTAAEISPIFRPLGEEDVGWTLGGISLQFRVLDAWA